MASDYRYLRGQSTPNSDIIGIPFQTLPPTRPYIKSNRTETYDSGSFQSPLLQGSSSPERPAAWGWQQIPRALRRGARETVFSLIGDIILLCGWLAVATFAVGIALSGGVAQSELTLNEALLTQSRIIVSWKLEGAPFPFPRLTRLTGPDTVSNLVCGDSGPVLKAGFDVSCRAR